MTGQTEPESLPMKDIPADERPRERLMMQGAGALSNAELLAIILRTGTATENVLHLSERILAHYGGLHGLAQATPAQLQQIKGLGAAKVSQIIAALEFAKRLTNTAAPQRPLIANADDAARLLADMNHLAQEHVRVILLDNSRRVIAVPTIYIGTMNATVLRVSEVYREAITRNSPAMILAHNHPSGAASPSPEDVEITRALVAAGKLLDIALLDHLIIGQDSWCSLKQLGLGFES